MKSSYSQIQNLNNFVRQVTNDMKEFRVLRMNAANITCDVKKQPTATLDVATTSSFKHSNKNRFSGHFNPFTFLKQTPHHSLSIIISTQKNEQVFLGSW